MGKYDIGNKFVTKEGYEIEIIEKYVGIDKSKIIFKESGLEMIVFNGCIRRGTIHNPSHILDKCCVGSNHCNNEGDLFSVVEKINNDERIIKFDGYENLKKVFTSAILRGRVKNCFKPSIYGVGFLGFDKIEQRHKKALECWRNMMRRCFSEEYKAMNPTYENVTVCEEWYNFKNFAEWYEENHINGYDLDKDILNFNKSIKIYSPKTCLFIPHDVNTFLVYHNYKNKGIIKSKYNKYQVRCNEFQGNGRYVGTYETYEEALKKFDEYKYLQAEKVKSYMRSLGYYSEEIIQLIK